MSVTTTFPFNADSSRHLSCVGVNDVIYFEITYWVDDSHAQDKQKEMIASKECEKYPEFSTVPWFSTEDFNALQQRLKLACEFDVCIKANQGTGYFSYCNIDSTTTRDKLRSTPTPVVRPLVLVTEYRAGVLQQGKDVDEKILSLINNRWGGAFCVFPGPLLNS